jgi:hypothetical protein
MTATSWTARRKNLPKKKIADKFKRNTFALPPSSKIYFPKLIMIICFNLPRLGIMFPEQVQTFPASAFAITVYPIVWSQVKYHLLNKSLLQLPQY